MKALLDVDRRSGQRRMRNDGPRARTPDSVAIPAYLQDTYWWAYVHPYGVQLFERQWLVNLILWGNFARLRDVALDALGEALHGRCLQIACVYGDLTERIVQRLEPGATLDVVDVVPIQLSNLRCKLRPTRRVALLHGDSAALPVGAARYDRALIFFLLHEQPHDARRATLAEALRVVRPGGRIAIVDYHRPPRHNPLHWPMAGILGALEPFALDLWRHEIATWLPADARVARLHKRTLFGGLYQVVTLDL